MERTCKKCNNTKPLTEFNWQCKKRGLKRAYCKFCDRLRARKDYHENREVRRASCDAYQKRVGYKAPGQYTFNKIAGVYMWVNLITGERYIGASDNVYRRRSSYWSVSNHLADYFKQWGKKNMLFGIIEECDNYQEREKHYIQIYNPELNTHHAK